MILLQKYRLLITNKHIKYVFREKIKLYGEKTKYYVYFAGPAMEQSTSAKKIKSQRLSFVPWTTWTSESAQHVSQIKSPSEELKSMHYSELLLLTRISFRLYYLLFFVLLYLLNQISPKLLFVLLFVLCVYVKLLVFLLLPILINSRNNYSVIQDLRYSPCDTNEVFPFMLPTKLLITFLLTHILNTHSSTLIPHNCFLTFINNVKISGFLIVLSNRSCFKKPNTNQHSSHHSSRYLYTQNDLYRS